MLQAGRCRFEPDEVTGFFSVYLILPTAQGPLRSTQPLRETSPRILPGGRGRPAHKAGNLTAICEPIDYRMWEP
jgi:hypothetical protein